MTKKSHLNDFFQNVFNQLKCLFILLNTVEVLKNYITN